MLCVGSSIAVLVVGRVLQGISAAIVWTVGLALLVDTVGQQGIGQVVGYVSIAMSVAILLAPLLGGIVYAKGGYYSVYYMAFALIVLDILLRLALVEKKVARKWIHDRALEQCTPAPPFKIETSALSTPPSNTATCSPSEAPVASRASRLPPVVTLLASRRLLSALWGCLVEAGLLSACEAVLPLRVNALFGWGSIGAGLLFLALIIPSFIAPLVGHISDKYGPRWLTFFGFLLSCPSLVLLRLVDHGGIRQIVLLCALLALLGTTLAMVMTPLIAEITYVVEDKEKKEPGKFGERGAYAQAYALFNCMTSSPQSANPLFGPIADQPVKVHLQLAR
ncbi:hypothetical protein MMC24_005375 [Lignoscripta atroalba]|nr:hypothetical protein [Lignoscripta atroalba]